MILHNKHKIVEGKILSGGKQKISKYRGVTNSYTDDFLRLVLDEAEGIIKTGYGYCFNEKQVEAIKNILKDKLTTKEFITLECKEVDKSFKISFKKARKKYTKKQKLVLA